MTTFTPEHFKGALSDMAISAGGLPLSPATDLMTALQLAEALADTAQRQGVFLSHTYLIFQAWSACLPVANRCQMSAYDVW